MLIFPRVKTVKGERTAWKIGADINGSAVPDIRTALSPEENSI
jgi:hypothetical protein